MSSTTYVTIYEEYRQKFFQLPKVFFTNEKYLNMSNNAKVAWSLLRDRSSLSRKNKWFDKGTGRIYFIFRNKELMKLTNIKSETTLIRVKKELSELNLIEEVRLGMNKPNKIYLLNPEITDDDIEKITNLENDQILDAEKDKNETPQSLEGRGTPKNEVPEPLGAHGTPKNEVHELQKMKSNYTEYSKTEFKEIDTLDTKDTKPDLQIKQTISNAEKERLKNEYMDKSFYENSEFIPEQLANILEVFSTTPEQAYNYYGIILRAKARVEKEQDVLLWLDDDPDLVHKIKNGFSRAIRKVEKEKKVDMTKKDGYIYSTIYNLIAAELSTRQRQLTNHSESVP